VPEERKICWTSPNSIHTQFPQIPSFLLHSLWDCFDTFLLDDVDGDGEGRKNGEADCDRNARLHRDVEPLMCVNTFLCEDRQERLEQDNQAQEHLHF